MSDSENLGECSLTYASETGYWSVAAACWWQMDLHSLSSDLPGSHSWAKEVKVKAHFKITDKESCELAFGLQLGTNFPRLPDSSCSGLAYVSLYLIVNLLRFVLQASRRMRAASSLELIGGTVDALCQA